MNIHTNNYIPSLSTPLQQDLPLNILNEEKQVLTLLQNCQFDPAHCGDLVELSLQNGWDDLLEWLSSKGADLVPFLVQAISSKDQNALENLLIHFKGHINASINGNDHETLLWYALNERNYTAANALINFGANLKQYLPESLAVALQNKFKAALLKNKNYYGVDSETLHYETYVSDYENSLAYAIATHYYPQDP